MLKTRGVEVPLVYILAVQGLLSSSVYRHNHMRAPRDRRAAYPPLRRHQGRFIQETRRPVQRRTLERRVVRHHNRQKGELYLDLFLGALIFPGERINFFPAGRSGGPFDDLYLKLVQPCYVLGQNQRLNALRDALIRTDGVQEPLKVQKISIVDPVSKREGREYGVRFRRFPKPELEVELNALRNFICKLHKEFALNQPSVEAALSVAKSELERWRLAYHKGRHSVYGYADFPSASAPQEAEDEPLLEEGTEQIFPSASPVPTQSSIPLRNAAQPLGAGSSAFPTPASVAIRATTNSALAVKRTSAGLTPVTKPRVTEPATRHSSSSDGFSTSGTNHSATSLPAVTMNGVVKTPTASRAMSRAGSTAPATAAVVAAPVASACPSLPPASAAVFIHAVARQASTPPVASSVTAAAAATRDIPLTSTNPYPQSAITPTGPPSNQRQLDPPVPLAPAVHLNPAPEVQQVLPPLQRVSGRFVPETRRPVQQRSLNRRASRRADFEKGNLYLHLLLKAIILPGDKHHFIPAGREGGPFEDIYVMLVRPCYVLGKNIRLRVLREALTKAQWGANESKVQKIIVVNPETKNSSREVAVRFRRFPQPEVDLELVELRNLVQKLYEDNALLPHGIDAAVDALKAQLGRWKVVGPRGRNTMYGYSNFPSSSLQTAVNSLPTDNAQNEHVQIDIPATTPSPVVTNNLITAESAPEPNATGT